MKTFKFLAGAVCLFFFLTSCEVDPINEDTDITNFKIELEQGQQVLDEIVTPPKPDKQVSQRTEDEDDHPGTGKQLGSVENLRVFQNNTKTEGEDDYPEGESK